MLRRSRGQFRFCKICKKGSRMGSRGGQMIQPCNCNPGSNYVHVRCQAKLMQEESVIACDKCKAQFRGLEYIYTPKSFAQYLVEVDSARDTFISTLSLIVSMVVSVLALLRIYLNDWDNFVTDVTDIDSNHTVEAFRHNINIVMLFHMKVVLPILSVYFTTRKTMDFWLAYCEWHKEHFNVIIK